MKLKVIVTTTALLVMSSAAAFATCKGKGHQQVMSCADGMTYDATTGTCVPVVNS
ncbi:MAG: chitin-binding domain-containing protein [Pseudomonadota bacterium]